MTDILGWEWIDFDELGSTNDKARELTAEPPAKRFVVTAETQNKGRGRRGRNWVGLKGNLFSTYALPLDIRLLGQFVFVISLSLQQTIKEMAPQADVKLKWPNDVLVNGAKISGILLEKGEGEYIIAGIGVNIIAAPGAASGLLYQATSLKEAGIETDRVSFLKAYLKRLNGFLELWEHQGFVAVRDLWLQNARGLGTEITVTTEKEVKRGIFRGVDDDGLLLLEKAGHLTKIYAGDVFYKEEK